MLIPHLGKIMLLPAQAWIVMIVLAYCSNSPTNPCSMITNAIGDFFSMYMRRNMSRWYSRVVIQGQRQEITDGLKMCFQAALKNYHKVSQILSIYLN